MILPDYVARCLDRLEQAGFAAYAVGGLKETGRSVVRTPLVVSLSSESA